MESNEHLFSSIPSKIINSYAVYQKEFAELSKTVPNIQLVEGFPNDLYDMTNAHDSSINGDFGRFNVPVLKRSTRAWLAFLLVALITVE